MSLDGSPKAKAVYEQSSKTLYCLSRNGAYHKFTVLVHLLFLAGPNLPPLEMQNIAKSQNFSKKLHPQEYQLTQSQDPEISANYVSLFLVITTHS